MLRHHNFHSYFSQATQYKMKMSGAEVFGVYERVSFDH